MNTLFTDSADGTRVAYDMTGAGPAVMLLHGAGQDRSDWHQAGYVDRLSQSCSVITVDIRGNGESDKPTSKEAYATERLCRDLIAVADACRLNGFKIWGFSYGGNIGRYLAARSSRVERIAILGIPFGPGASGEFRKSLEESIARWKAILKAQQDGSLSHSNLQEEEIEYLQSSKAALDVARRSALLDWSAIEPGDLVCPALWLVGSENASAMQSVREYATQLVDSQVEVKILDGLDHWAEFADVETVFPVLRDFAHA